jgi:hypothetical protein
MQFWPNPETLKALRKEHLQLVDESLELVTKTLTAKDITLKQASGELAVHWKEIMFAI